MKHKLYFILLALLIACSNKQEENNNLKNENISTLITDVGKEVGVENVDSLIADSLNHLFDRLYFFRENYAHELNVSENFPKLLQEIEALKITTNRGSYFSELERLIELFSISKKYKDKETDELNSKIVNKIFTKNQLDQIRTLYRSKFSTDSSLTAEYNLERAFERYNRIDYYLKKQYYFRDSLISKFWELCPIYFDIRREINKKNKPKTDSVKNHLLKKEVSFSGNKSLVVSLISKNQSDSLLPSYLKNIAPIFEPINNSSGVYGMDANYYGDKQLFDEEKLLQDSKALEYSDSVEIYAYSAKERKRVQPKSIGFQLNECIGSFYFYELRSTFELDEKLLFSSTHALELDYKNYPFQDSLLTKHNVSICVDCPSGWSNQKTYAKLKGFDNIYFTATSSNYERFDDTDTYIRAIYYISEQNVFPLWNKEFDAFGCACL